MSISGIIVKLDWQAVNPKELPVIRKLDQDIAKANDRSPVLPSSGRTILELDLNTELRDITQAHHDYDFDISKIAFQAHIRVNEQAYREAVDKLTADGGKLTIGEHIASMFNAIRMADTTDLLGQHSVMYDTDQFDNVRHDRRYNTGKTSTDLDQLYVSATEEIVKQAGFVYAPK